MMASTPAKMRKKHLLVFADVLRPFQILNDYASGVTQLLKYNGLKCIFYWTFEKMQYLTTHVDVGEKGSWDDWRMGGQALDRS